MTARSLLFVPGSAPKRVAGATGRGADALVFDLEDAVIPAQKVVARAAVAAACQAHDGVEELIVRVNAVGSPWHSADIDALDALGTVTIMLPKAEKLTLDAVNTRLPIIALIETAQGVEDAYAIARDPRVIRVMLGSADLAADVGFALTPDEGELGYPRSRVAFASAAAGLPGAIDVVHLDVHDDVGLAASARRAKELGYAGKACIHPNQVTVINSVFAPSGDEIADAAQIIREFEAAAAAGSGVLIVAGRFVDLPVVERARRTLALAAGQKL